MGSLSVFLYRPQTGSLITISGKKTNLFLATRPTLFLGADPKLCFPILLRKTWIFFFRKRGTQTLFLTHFLSKHCEGLQEDYKIHFDLKIKNVPPKKKKKKKKKK